MSKLKKTAFLVRCYRVFRLALLIISGALVALTVFRICGDRRRLALKQTWSAAVLDALGIQIEADVLQAVPGALLIANHISWLDIFLINAVLPAAFVSKEEVRRWPVIGWLAAKNDTVFLRRGSRGHARVINAEIAAILGQGKFVAVFPEGTTTDGFRVQHFHGALLQPALAAGHPVVPLALSYWNEDGQRSLVPRYDGDLSLGQCTKAILACKKLRAKVSALPPLGLQGEDRRQVALVGRAAIAEAVGLPPPSN